MQRNLVDGATEVATARRARDVFEKFLNAHPADSEARGYIASSATTEGRALAHANKVDEAISLFERALAIREAFVHEDPTNTTEKRRVMLLHSYIADMLWNSGASNKGDSAGSAAHYRECVRIADDLYKADTTNSQTRYDLAMSHSRLAAVLRDRKEYSAALREFDASIPVFAAQARSEPANRTDRTHYSGALLDLGECHLAMDNAMSAKETFLRTLEVADPLFKAEEVDPGLAAVVADTHLFLAKLLLKEDRSGAVDHAIKGQHAAHVAVLRQPVNVNYRRRLQRTAASLDEVYGVDSGGSESTEWKRAMATHLTEADLWWAATTARDTAGLKAAHENLEKSREQIAELLQQSLTARR